MATSTDNLITFGANGTFGGQFVFRRRYGKVMICKMPKPYEGEPTANQQLNRERFSKANIYAKAAIADPVMKERYQKMAKEGRAAYHKAFSDAYNAPKFKHVKLKDYTGLAGSTLAIRVKDDFWVDRVTVTFLNEAGFEEETGEALRRGMVTDFEYTVKYDLKAVKIRVKAYDLPGNETVLDVDPNPPRVKPDFSKNKLHQLPAGHIWWDVSLYKTTVLLF